MPRSAEALKRRAEKRNISENEMRKIDAQPLKKNKSDATDGASQSPRNSAKKPPKGTPNSQSLKKWICKVCTNINLAHMCPKKCNNCARPRVEVDDEYEWQDHATATASSTCKTPLKASLKDDSSHWKCSKCNNKNVTKYFPKTCNRCQRDRDTEAEEESAKNTTTPAKPVPVPECTHVSTKQPKVEKDSDKHTKAVVKVEKKPESATGELQQQDTLSSKYWICLVCKNRNVCALHTLTCNRCQRHRKEVETKTTTTVAKSSEGPSSLKAAEAPFAVPAAVKPTDNTHWFCKVCNNRNICAVHKLNCNRCQRHRSEVEKKDTLALSADSQCTTSNNVAVTKTTSDITANKSTPAKPSPEVWTCVKCKNKNLLSLSLSACNRCQRPRAVVDSTTPSVMKRKRGNTDDDDLSNDDEEDGSNRNSWDTSVADKDLIANNMKLREDYLDPEVRKTMSEDDKARAVVLIERSKRKAEKKEKRNAWKKKIKKR
jgi:hypothetical protein